LEKIISTGENKKILEALSILFRYPPSVIQAGRDNYVKSLHESLRSNLSLSYKDIVVSIPPEYVRANQEFYAPILNEIVKNYSTCSSKLWPGEILLILDSFAKLNVTNTQIYNKILSDIGRHFHSFRDEQYISIMEAFARASINQSDLFEQSLLKLQSSSLLHGQAFLSAIMSCFNVGHASKTAKTLIPEVYKATHLQKPSKLFPFAIYFPILNLENEAELMKSIIPKLKNAKFITQSVAMVLYDYLRINYKDQPELAQTVREIIYNFDQVKKNINQDSLSKTQSKDLVTSI